MPLFAQEWWLMPAVLFLVGCIASHRIALHRLSLASPSPSSAGTLLSSSCLCPCHCSRQLSSGACTYIDGLDSA